MADILARHPAPWRYGKTGELEMGIVDDAGDPVLESVSNAITEVDDIRFASPEAERLILAAIELLAALKTLAHAANARETCADLPELESAYTLIARIEGK